MRIELCDDKDCTGCGACAGACPKGCITLESDPEGFLRPWIQQDLCVGCGLCRSVCPALTPKGETALPEALGAYARDLDIRQASSSGGIFTVLAQAVLARGGVVFGAAFQEDFQRVGQIMVQDAQELHRLRGSKYVQSDTGDSYRQARTALDAGKLVYYAGTPCQIAGLKAYLGGDRENLITQDLICHGVPSPGVWQDYLQELQESRKSQVRGFSFRDKTFGWKDFGLRVHWNAGKTNWQSQTGNLFMRGFLKNIYLRPSCYNCPIKAGRECSDLTLADFWGLRHLLPDWNDDKGVTLVLVRSEKGRDLLRQVADELRSTPVDTAGALQHNSAALHSVQEPPARAEFFHRRSQGVPFSANVKKSCPLGWKARLRQILPPGLGRGPKPQGRNKGDD